METSSEVERLIAGTPVDSIDMEATALKRKVLEKGARELERNLNADKSDHVASSLPCGCGGGNAHYLGRRSKRFTTALGELERAYYHCGACHTGFCPRDRALGMEKTSLSPASLRMIRSLRKQLRNVERHNEGVGGAAG